MKAISRFFGLNTYDMGWRELHATRWRRLLFCVLLCGVGALWAWALIWILG